MIEVVPLYPLAAVLFLAAGLVFALQMARHLRVFLAARPSSVVDEPEARLRSFLRHAVLQLRMFREPLAGVVHALIFWGFIVLTLGTIDRIFFGVVEWVAGGILDGLPWRLLLVAQNAFMLAVLAAVVVALGRRVLTRPRRLTLSWDGLVILLLIGGVVLSELLAEAFRLARYGDPDASYAFAANTLAGVLEGAASDPQAGWLAAGYALAFWSNVLIICLFLAYLPRSKHLHIVTAALNTAFAKLAPRGRLPALDLEAESATFGVRTVADLGWKDLLDGFTCTECGRCQEACPAWATGKPLNPKTMIMGLRDMAVEAEQGMPLVP